MSLGALVGPTVLQECIHFRAARQRPDHVEVDTPDEYHVRARVAQADALLGERGGYLGIDHVRGRGPVRCLERLHNRLLRARNPSCAYQRQSYVGQLPE